MLPNDNEVTLKFDRGRQYGDFSERKTNFVPINKSFKVFKI